MRRSTRSRTTAARREADDGSTPDSSVHRHGYISSPAGRTPGILWFSHHQPVLADCSAERQQGSWGRESYSGDPFRVSQSIPFDRRGIVYKLPICAKEPAWPVADIWVAMPYAVLLPLIGKH